MKNIALFVFNGDPMCFIHVLLNAHDMSEKGINVQVVVEGAAVKLIPGLAKPENPLNKMWESAKSKGLIAGVCRACSSKLGTLKDAEAQALTLLDGMSGHPSMLSYMDEGYEVVTF